MFLWDQLLHRELRNAACLCGTCRLKLYRMQHAAAAAEELKYVVKGRYSKTCALPPVKGAEASERETEGVDEVSVQVGDGSHARF